MCYTDILWEVFMKYPNGWFKIKNCRKCSSEFQPTAPSHHYCSDECKEWGRINAYYTRVYGLTYDEVRAMADERDHKCDICGEKGFLMDPSKHIAFLVVDHCHATGKVRGLLCHNCNRVLGLMKDSPELLRKAAEYLQV
ncbi:endonuclease [Pseudomonas phage TL]|uniref:Endonuclease n=2 Tax=Bruynoghevirus TaxID=545932 RepID=A9J6Z9_BPLUZ|nr:endonuclease VII [Bruynoghevirus LUZ24]YP_009007824.1 endonuclease VII [Pseudomonas phage TL]CAP45436.1 endonuclease [Bruynoghevirus LUZ24]CDI06794.1 endonuclease [Pseudomonas phage TL]